MGLRKENIIMFGKLRDSWVVWRRKVNEKFGTFNPEPKTEDMTVPVGVDSEGRLWTSGEGGGGGGGTKCYKIEWITEPSSMDNRGGFTLTFKPLVDYTVVDSGFTSALLTADGYYTFSVQTGDDNGEIMFLFYGDIEIYTSVLPPFYVAEYNVTNIETGTDVSKAITVTEVTL